MSFVSDVQPVQDDWVEIVAFKQRKRALDFVMGVVCRSNQDLPMITTAFHARDVTDKA